MICDVFMHILRDRPFKVKTLYKHIFTFYRIFIIKHNKHLRMLEFLDTSKGKKKTTIFTSAEC